MTRILGIELERLALPLRAPFPGSGGTLRARRRLGLVRLLGPDGLVGVGEIAPEADSPLEGVSERLREVLEGGDLDDAAELDRHLREMGSWPHIGRSVRAAIETAALDLRGQAAGRPAAELLGAPHQSTVRLNGLVVAVDPGPAARAAERLVAEGFGCLKLKGGREPSARLVARVAAVRSAVGPTVGLRVDVNGAWSSVLEALEALEALAALGIEYVEQPLPAELGPDALAGLRRRTTVPLAADESVADPPAARVLLDAGAVDVLVVKPARVGGPFEACRIVELAAAEGTPVVLSTLLETGIGLAVALHVAATTRDPARAHGLATGTLLASDLLAEPLVVESGRMRVPQGAGLGVRLDPGAVERHRLP